MTTPGLMQDAPLLTSGILGFAAEAHGRVEIVSRLIDEPTWRYDYAGLMERVARLSRALQGLGVRAGDRVASLAWNTHRHLELFYAVTGIGAVLHTANPRLFDDQIAFVLNHGGAKVLFLDKNLSPLVERLTPKLTTLETFVILGEESARAGSGLECLAYETLIDGQDGSAYTPEPFAESSGAVLCYTSGTTGDPKGVLYSHRSIVLHALAAGLPGTMNLSAFDVIMPCSSLYHATGWGLPFIAPINGCKLVLPGDRMDAESLYELIKDEGVTFATGVPTIWSQFLRKVISSGTDAAPLRRILIGGSAVPKALFEGFETFGVDILQVWGMTETSPLGVVASPTPALAAASAGHMQDVLRTRQGRRIFGVDVRVVDEAGRPVPADGQTSGAVQVRGPWVIRRYFRADADVVDQDGWFDTGDIATMDSLGYLRLTDRAKDVIKSGGEWVSSIDLENEACACPGVRIVAAVGVPHPKWDERPILVVELHEGVDLTPEALIEFLAPKVVKWWLPDLVIFDTVPMTATGKIDKKALRLRYSGVFENA